MVKSIGKLALAAATQSYAFHRANVLMDGRREFP